MRVVDLGVMRSGSERRCRSAYVYALELGSSQYGFREKETATPRQESGCMFSFAAFSRAGTLRDLLAHDMPQGPHDVSVLESRGRGI